MALKSSPDGAARVFYDPIKLVKLNMVNVKVLYVAHDLSGAFKNTNVAVGRGDVCSVDIMVRK